MTPEEDGKNSVPGLIYHLAKEQPFFGSLRIIIMDILLTLYQRGSKYNQHGITPDDYLKASPALNEIEVIVLRLKAVKDDPEEMMKIYPDLINYALMDMCRITNERKGK